MSKPFLIDVDDVCLEWFEGFSTFMADLGYQSADVPPTEWDLSKHYPTISYYHIQRCIQQFPMSEAYHELKETVGAVPGIEALRNLFPDSLFIAVTCSGTHSTIKAAREHQLRHFPFDAKIYLPISGSKERVYKSFSSPVVIDDNTDHVKHAIKRAELAILFERHHNKWFDSSKPNYRRVRSWAEIVRLFSAIGD